MWGSAGATPSRFWPDRGRFQETHRPVGHRCAKRVTAGAPGAQAASADGAEIDGLRFAAAVRHGVTSWQASS